MSVVTIPYKPRPAFLPFHNSTKRFSVLVCHRGAGKTVSAMNHLIRAACLKAKGIYAFISPTYTQGKRTAWPYLKEFSEPIPGVRFNESELKAEFPNGSSIYLLGSENPQSLRGMHLDGVIFDEYSQQPPSVWGEIIRPAIAAKQGFCIWIGTPIGKNAFWRLYDDNKNNEAWYTLYLRASESGIIPPSELELARKSMTKEEYEQEYELEPTAAIRGAIYGTYLIEARKENRICTFKPDPFIPVDTYWDIGVSDATAIIFAQTLGSERRIIDYYEMTGADLHHYVKILKDRGYNYGVHWFPHDMKVREMATGRSRFEIMSSFLPNQDLRIVPRIARKDQSEVSEGINAARMLFPNVWINSEKCNSLIEALESYRYEWDEDLKIFRPRPFHDWCSHGADAFRYLATVSRISQDEFTSAREQGKMEGISGLERDSDDLIPW